MENYEVLVKAYCTVVVQNATSEDEALELAMENVNRGSFEVDDLRIERKLDTEEELNQAVRHAEQVI